MTNAAADESLKTGASADATVNGTSAADSSVADTEVKENPECKKKEDKEVAQVNGATSTQLPGEVIKWPVFLYSLGALFFAVL